MSTTGERIKGLRLYNNYSLDDLAHDLMWPQSHLAALENDQMKPDDDEAKDLSHYLGADASYFRKAEQKRYLAYVHIAYKLEETGLVETEAWEQSFIDAPYDIYKMTVIVNNLQNEASLRPGELIFCDQEDADGLSLVRYQEQEILALKKANAFYRHNHEIEAKPLYHIAFHRQNLEDLLLDLTRKMKSGEMDI